MVPPGRVTRIISSRNLPGSGMCSSTLEENATSTAASVRGSRLPSPATLRLGARRPGTTARR